METGLPACIVRRRIMAPTRWGWSSAIQTTPPQPRPLTSPPSPTSLGRRDGADASCYTCYTCYNRLQYLWQCANSFCAAGNLLNTSDAPPVGGVFYKVAL